MLTSAMRSAVAPLFFSLTLGCAAAEDRYDPSRYSANIVKAPTVANDGGETGSQPTPEPQAQKTQSGLTVGSKIELTLPDQFDRAHTINQKTRALLLTFSKKQGEDVQTFLDKRETGYLEAKGAAFLMDISPIPVFVRNKFVLPKLRESAYPILLIYEKKIAKSLKNTKQGEKIAVVALKDNIVQSIEYLGKASELAMVLP